jgi:hypothetical protein
MKSDIILIFTTEYPIETPAQCMHAGDLLVVPLSGHQSFQYLGKEVIESARNSYATLLTNTLLKCIPNSCLSFCNVRRCKITIC